MKRRLLFLAFVLSTVVGWSQTVTLKFKNGTTQQYDMSELESIDFKDGDNNNSGNDDVEVEITEANLVGVWECTSYNYQSPYGEPRDHVQPGEKVQFYSDGSYETQSEKGSWTLDGRSITLYNGTTQATCNIDKLTSKVFEITWRLGVIEITIKYKRIS